MTLTIYNLFRLLFGTLYPAYASYKAVKTKNVKEYVKWMMYWIVFAFFTCVETFADIFISWVPFYYEMKILFVLWLLSPATKGASILYRKFLHPQLAKREKEIDAYIAKASDQGYSAILSLGSKGFNYATNVVLTTAIKSQAKITDHLRKSYSMNDLSGGTPHHRLHPEESEPEMDDETDNRLIEESYREEMMEKDRRVSALEGDIDDKENIVHHREKTDKHASKEDPGLYRVDETEEEAMAKGGRKSYSHKEVIDASNAQAKTSCSTPVPVAARKSSLSGSAVTDRKNSLSGQSMTDRNNSRSGQNVADRNHSLPVQNVTDRSNTVPGPNVMDRNNSLSGPNVMDRNNSLSGQNPTAGKNSSSSTMNDGKKLLSNSPLTEKPSTWPDSMHADEHVSPSLPTTPTVTVRQNSFSAPTLPDLSPVVTAMKNSPCGPTRYMAPGTISGLKNAPDVKCNPFNDGVSTSVCNPYAKMSTTNNLSANKNPTPPDSPAPWRFRKDYSESAWK